MKQAVNYDPICHCQPCIVGAIHSGMCTECGGFAKTKRSNSHALLRDIEDMPAVLTLCRILHCNNVVEVVARTCSRQTHVHIGHHLQAFLFTNFLSWIHTARPCTPEKPSSPDQFRSICPCTRLRTQASRTQQMNKQRINNDSLNCRPHAMSLPK